MFCCTTCKENAMNSYHDKEARLLSILENSGLGQEEWLVSLRLVLSKSLSFFLKNRKELLANCERRDYAANDSIDDETFMSSDYSSVFNLVILFSLRTLEVSPSDWHYIYRIRLPSITEKVRMYKCW